MWSAREDYSPAGRCKQRCLATLGANLLRRFSSSLNSGCKKASSKSWPFLNVVGERGLFPCGPLQATLSRYARRKPPSEVLILFKLRMQKGQLKELAFSECGRRERIRTSDPLVPNQLRYQAALLAECGAHLTAHRFSRQSLNLKIQIVCFKSQRLLNQCYCAACCGTWHQLLFSLIPPFGEV